MKKLDKYVGRIVRLNKQVFEKIAARYHENGKVLENCFLVAAVGLGMSELICYGANLRIVVNVYEVAFI